LCADREPRGSEHGQRGAYIRRDQSAGEGGAGGEDPGRAELAVRQQAGRRAQQPERHLPGPAARQGPFATNPAPGPHEQRDAQRAGWLAGNNFLV